MNLKLIFINRIGLIALAFVLSSCSGGDGKGATENKAEDRRPVSANALGYMYYADERNIYRHEVATGIVTQHIRNNFRFSESATASDDASLFSVLNYTHTLIDIFDSQSTYLTRVIAQSGEKFTAPVEFSPNNNYFMVYRYADHNGDGDVYQLEIYNSAGLKSRLQYPISGYDWVSDDEITFIVGDSIYRQRLSSGADIVGQPELIYQFAGQLLWGLSVSPDGKQIAVINRGISIHVVDIDGGGDRQVARILTNPNGEIDGLNAVRWSPDGKALAVGTKALEIGPYAAGCSIIATMPANLDSIVDIGDKKNWLGEIRNREVHRTCVGDLFSFSWRSQ